MVGLQRCVALSKEEWLREKGEELRLKLSELDARLARISGSVRRGLEADSGERAVELENSEVVDALGNEARAEVREIKAALRRLDSGTYGICEECGGAIPDARLGAHPFARRCLDCAEFSEFSRTRSP